MRLLAYYISHTFVNSLKKLFRTWVIIFFAIIVVFGIIGAVIGGVASVLIPGSDQEISSEEETQEGNPSTGSYEIESKVFLNQEDSLPRQITEVSISLIILILTLLNLYGGEKSGSQIFTMADVNFLFAAPKKPQSVLLFKIILKMGTALLGSVYLLFQLPNLILNLGLGVKAGICFIIAFVLLLMFVKLLSIFTYTITSTNTKYKRYIRPTVLFFSGIILTIFVVIMKITEKSPLDVAVTLFASKWNNYIPMVGWIRGFAISAMYDDNRMLLIYAGLTVAGILLLILIIWNYKADFYEDALTGAAEMSERLETAKSGNSYRKKYSDKLTREGIGHGKGANVFLMKQLYNRRRFAKFGFFTITMVYYFAICMVVSVVTLKYAQTTGITLLVGILLANVFFRSLGNPIELETTHNFLYIVPETAISKISFSVLAGSVESFLDLIPGYLVASIVLQNGILRSSLLFIWILSFDFLLSSSAVLIEMLLPSSLHDVIKGLLAILLKLIVVIPFLSILAISAYLEMAIPGIILSAILILAMGSIFLLLSSLTLHRGKI